MSYEIGKIYIWQNQVGAAAFRNGSECTVVSAPGYYLASDGKVCEAQVTDAPPISKGSVVVAMSGDLRPKNPPKGEQSILNAFKAPTKELEPA